MAKRFVLLHVNPKLEDSLSPPPAPSSLSLSAPQKQPSLNTDESLIHQNPSSSSSIRLMKPSPASSSSPSPSRRVSLPAVGLDQKAQTEAVLRSPEARSTSLYKEDKEENHSVVVELGPLEGKNSNITVDRKLRAEEKKWNAAAVQEQRKFHLDEEEEEMVDRKRESIITHIANMQKVGDDNRTNDQIRRHSFHGLNNNSGGGGGIKEFSRRRSLDIKRVEKRRIYVRPELTYQFVEVIRPERTLKAPKLDSAHAEMEENMTEVPKFSKKLLENKAQAPGIPQKLVEIEVKAPESPQKVQESTIEVPKTPKNAVTLSLSPTRVIPGRRRPSTESLSSKRESIHSENHPDFPSDIASDVDNRKLEESGDENRKESMLNPATQSRGSDDNWDSRQSIRNLMRRRSSSRRSPSRRSKSPSIVSSMLQRHSYRESIYTNRHTQSIHGIVRPVREEGRSEISDDSSIEDGSSMDLFMGLKMKQEFLALQQNLEEEQKLKREEENQKMSRRSVVFITPTSINSRAGSMNLGLTSQSQVPTVEEASRRLSGSIISDNNASTVESNLVPLVYPDHCCRHKRRYPYGMKVESSKDIITTVESDFIPEDRLHITESLEEGLGTIQRYWENQQTRPKSAFHVFKPIENSTTTQRYSKTGAATKDSIEQVYQASETLMNPPEVQDTLAKESQPSPKKSSISSENPVSVPQRSNYKKEETQVGDPIHQHDDGQKPSAKSLMSDQNCQRAENQQQSNELDQSPSAKRLPSKNRQRVENHHQSNENETPSVKRVDNHKSNESTKSPTAKSSSSSKAPNDLFDKQFTGAQIEYSDGAPNINSEAGSQPHANHTVDRGSFSLPSSSSGNNVLHSQTGGRMEEECSEDSALNEVVLFLPSADLQQEEGKNGIMISSSTLTSTSVVEEFQKPDSTAVLIAQYQRSSLLSSSLNARDDSSETKDLPLRKSTAEYRSMDLTEKGINQSYDGFESNKLEVITHIVVEEEGDDLNSVQEASSSYIRQNYCQDAVMGFQTEDLGLMIEQEEEEETHPIMSLQQPRLSLMSTTIDNSYGFLSSPKASLPLLQRESQFAILPISKGVEKEDERRRKSVIIEALQLASPLKNELSDNRTRRKSSLQNLGSELPIPEKRSSLQDLEQESEEDKRIESRSSFLQNGRGEEVGYDLAEMMQMLGKRSSSKSLPQAGMENDEKRIRRSSHSRKNSEQRINRIENIATKSKDRLLSEYTKRKKKSSILASSPVEEKERKMHITNSNHNTDSSLLTEIHSPYAFLLLLLLLLLLMLAVVPAIRFICQAGSFATHIQNYGQPPT